MLTRRETLHGVALLAAAEKLTDGGMAAVSLPGEPDRGGERVLPPGAGKRSEFACNCIGCGVCIAACPEHCLRPSSRWNSFGQPEMDFRHGYCRLACSACVRVCPVGALRLSDRVRRAQVHLGHAVWRRELCLNAGEGAACSACERKCPVKAIRMVKGLPVVDETVCVGCGACEHVCPVRPLPAIYVKGHEVQRQVEPMDGAAELRGEMQALIRGGKSAVVAKGAAIVKVLEGRGIRPIYEALAADGDCFRDALVADKIVGRAAAAIYVAGGAAEVNAEVMSEGAYAYLVGHGVKASAAVRTPEIINRQGDGSCPMELAVRDLDNPRSMIEAIGKAMKL